MVNYSTVVVIAEAVGESISLRGLSLRYSDIGDDGAKAIAKAITKSKTLCELDLWFCRIGNEGAVALAEAFAKSTTMIYMQLESNRDTMPEIGGQALAKTLILRNAKVKSFHFFPDIHHDSFAVCNARKIISTMFRARRDMLALFLRFPRMFRGLLKKMVIMHFVRWC